MFVEVIPNVLVRADCVYRISITGNIVAVMFNDGTGGQSQTVSWTFPDAEAARKWASGVGEGVTNAMQPAFLSPSQAVTSLVDVPVSYPERHQKRKQ